MRPYRGKRKDNGEWVYGWYVHEKLNDKHFIFYEPSFLADRRFDALVGYVEVDPATVGQSTGLRDKNGKEIYEGDKIKFGDNKFWCVVVWNNKGFYQLWRNGMIHWTLWIDDYYHNSGHRKDLEIIGTIHDKPEEENANS